MTAGVSNVKEFVLAQRKLVTQQAASGGSGSARPPEIRVSKFSNSGSLKMGFTADVKVPDGTDDLIKEQTEKNRRLLADGLPPDQSLISVFAVKEEEGEEDELSDPIMDGWELLSIGPEGFEIRLNFTNPVAISSSDEPDLLLIQLDLSSFENESGQKFPESLVKYSPIPT